MEDSENIFHLDEINESTSHSEPCKKKRRRRKKNDRGKDNRKDNGKDNGKDNRKDNGKDSEKKKQQSNNEFVFKQINELHKELFDTKLKINNILSKLELLKNSIGDNDNLNNTNTKTNTKTNKTINKKIKQIGNNVQLKIEPIIEPVKIEPINIEPEDRCHVSFEMLSFLKFIKKDKKERNEGSNMKGGKGNYNVNEDNLTIQIVISSIHLYIKENNLQDMEKKNNILYDEHLKNLFKLKKNQKLTFFNLPKFIKNHID